MNIEELESAALYFREITTMASDAVLRYDAFSDALVWSDEQPAVRPSLWWSTRPVLRHRTCVMVGESSEYRAWWDRAMVLFPQWIGFAPQRCCPTDRILEIYRSGRAQLERDIAQAETELDP